MIIVIIINIKMMIFIIYEADSNSDQRICHIGDTSNGSFAPDSGSGRFNMRYGGGYEGYNGFTVGASNKSCVGKVVVPAIQLE